MKIKNIKWITPTQCNLLIAKGIDRIKPTIIKLLCQIISDGEARTGESGYAKGGAYKKVWSYDIVEILQAMEIPCERYNIAPRGGACGERVKITNRRKTIANRKLINLMLEEE